MASNTTKTFNTFAQSRLTAAISAAAVTCDLLDDPTHLFSNWVTGSEFYMTLVDASANREIVKVTAISGSQLTITRGQGGTDARAWPVGSLIEQRPTKDDMAAFIQPAAFRTVAYNPNGVISATYPGEKVYQTDAGACKKRWWKNVTSNLWQLIAGTICDGEIVDTDPESPTYGYIIKGWTAYFDNTCWQPFGGLGSWDGSEWDASWHAAGGGFYELVLEEIGTWAVSLGEPSQMRLTFTGASYLDINAVYTSDMDNLGNYTCWHGDTIQSGEAFALNWTGKTGHIDRLLTNTGTINTGTCTGNPHDNYSITNIEFFG